MIRMAAAINATEPPTSSHVYIDGVSDGVSGSIVFSVSGILLFSESPTAVSYSMGLSLSPASFLFSGLLSFPSAIF